MPFYLGLDLGTSGCRAMVIDQQNNVQALSQLEFPDPKRDGNRVEQDPLIWWSVVQRVLKQLSQHIDTQQIKTIAVDGTSASVLLIDDTGQPQTAALMYNDARAVQQAELIQKVAADNSVDAGATASATSSLAKLCWWLQNDPQSKLYRISHQSDWIAALLCDRYGVSDTNNCLKLGYDPVLELWPDWLPVLSVPLSMLPTVLQPGSLMGTIRADLASEFNLSIDTQIIAGTTDSTAAAIATGACEIADAITTLGSTLVSKTLAASPYSCAEYGVYSQPMFKHWLVGGASNSGGAVLKRYFSDQQIQALSTQLDPYTDTQLDYYPLLSAGERFPINDANFAPRMTPRPDNDLLFFQAILEGIAKIEKMGYDRLAALGAPYPRRVITMGGGAKNTAWCQMRERILAVPVTAAKVSDAAYGAAILAKGSRA